MHKRISSPGGILTVPRYIWMF